MPTILTNGIQLPDKGSVDWYGSMQSNYNLIDTHLGDTDTHVTAEDRANWNSKQGSLSQAQLDAIAQVATNTSDIATLQSSKANTSHTHSSSDITDIDDYATKDYVDSSISGLVDNAPAALDTLKELSTALNDDANFATTVTNALSAKANSADLATVATSGSYTDLTDKPTINDSTITIQKNGSTVDTFTTNGSAKTINITVPTKTSDLTNDSNFVDTSNSAVASGITSAKVTDYDTHVADTVKHVTASDKQTWNGKQDALSQTQLDAVNSGIDSSKVQQIATNTSDISSLQSGKANDSDVVHKSGDETISGNKVWTGTNTFKQNMTYERTNLYHQATNPTYILKDTELEKGSLATTHASYPGLWQDKNGNILGYVRFVEYSSGRQTAEFKVSNLIKNGALDPTGSEVNCAVNLELQPSGEKSLIPEQDNDINLGTSTKKWKGVYATNYYYGSNNVEFSTKFVTTDTAQTISGSKTFEGVDLKLKSVAGEYTVSSGSTSLLFYDKNSLLLSLYKQGVFGSGLSYQTFSILGYDSNNQQLIKSITFGSSNLNLSTAYLKPDTDNAIALGRSNAKWSDVQTYKVNNLEPSSLSLPDLDNGVDISSYLDTSQSSSNTYTPVANGWISIKGRSNITNGIAIIQGDMVQMGYSIIDFGSSDRISFCALPVKAGVQVEIWLKSVTTLDSAKFYPCLGNV